MISNATYHISREGVEPIYLGPFGAAELQGHIPINPATIPHQDNAQERYGNKTPKGIAEARAASPASTWWGVYRREISRAGFIGFVGMRTTDEPVDVIRPVQEIGTLIIPVEERRKGAGTLAKLGAMEHAREHSGTHTFRSFLSANNPGSPTSLGRLGFVLFDTQPSDKYPDGADEQEWRWATAQGIAAGAAGDSEVIAERLLAGQRTYQDYLARTAILPVIA